MAGIKFLRLYSKSNDESKLIVLVVYNSAINIIKASRVVYSCFHD